MILFWIAAAVLAAIVVAVLAHPLLARRAAAGEERLAYDLAIYRDQLAEVARALAAGEVTEAEAAASRTEIERRVLAAADRTEKAPPPAAARALLAGALALLLPVGALGLYGWHGAPDLPGQPLADRPPVSADNGAEQRRHQEVAVLARRLEQHPDDLEGWERLGGVLMQARRYAEAGEAYRHRLTLGGERPDLLAAYGQALTLAADGMVTPAAKEAFSKAGDDPRARFFLAEAAVQAGDLRAGLAGLVALETASPADASWRPAVRQRIEELARKLGVAAPPVAEGPPPSAASAIAGLPPAEREKAIRGMVEGLEQRLEANPQDREGWHRLARAWRVLKEPARAEAALQRGLAAFPDDVPLLLALADAQLEAAGGDEKPLSPDFLATIRAVARKVPDHPQVLWYLGRAAADGGDADEARRMWGQLLEKMPADSPARQAVEARLAALPKKSSDLK